MAELGRVLLCAPDHYEVKYSINPWMQGQHVDGDQARRQFDALIDVYQDIGLKPVVLAQEPNLPDMVFTANAGLLLKDVFIPSNFRYPERAAEAEVFADFFAAEGRQVARLDPGVVFEGAGDALFLGDRLVLGYGFRSVRGVREALAPFLPAESIVRLGLSNPYFYHLDTCFSPLPSGRFLYYPDAFDDQSRKVLEGMGGYWVTERFCIRYGCNMVAVGDVMVTSCADDRLREIAAAEDLDIMELDVGEFIKAGGGVRCLSFLH